MELPAARWIGAMIRMTSQHPAMARVLDIVERLQSRPYRTNVVLTGEPGSGKEGLARALHHLGATDAPLVRFDVAGYPEDEAIALLCGRGRRSGVAEAAHGGSLLITEMAGLGPRLQAILLTLLKTGRLALSGDDSADRAGSSQKLDVRIIAMSDLDLEAEVKAGRLRHDLYYRLARVVLWLPPLRERPEDIAPSAIWMGNRILRAAGAQLELMSAIEFERADAAERKRALALDASAVTELEKHAWPGNFRELEAVLERALLIYRDGVRIDAAAVRAALSRADGAAARTTLRGT